MAAWLGFRLQSFTVLASRTTVDHETTSLTIYDLFSINTLLLDVVDQNGLVVPKTTSCSTRVMIAHTHAQCSAGVVSRNHHQCVFCFDLLRILADSS